MITLSIEQMKHLEELGVYTKNASMYWIVNTKDDAGKQLRLIPPYLSIEPRTQTIGKMGWEIIPAFTLQDIIELLPISIYEPASDGYKEGYADLRINKTCVWYESWHDDDHEVISFRKDTLLNSAYEMLCWVMKYKGKYD